jgi:hypothetical protein
MRYDCNKCGSKLPDGSRYKSCQKCRLDASLKVRERAIASLGGACTRCGEKDKRYLSIYSETTTESAAMYRLVALGRIEGTLLCSNCKTLKTWYSDTFDRVLPRKNSKFDIDVSYGKEREHRFSDMIHSKMEVKSDRKANITGNIYVEFESRGKPGGVASTEADVWVQEVDEDVFIVMPVSRMKELVRIHLDKYGETLGGDGHTSRGVLLRVSNLTKPIKE